MVSQCFVVIVCSESILRVVLNVQWWPRLGFSYSYYHDALQGHMNNIPPATTFERLSILNLQRTVYAQSGNLSISTSVTWSKVTEKAKLNITSSYIIHNDLYRMTTVTMDGSGYRAMSIIIRSLLHI